MLFQSGFFLLRIPRLSVINATIEACCVTVPGTSMPTFVWVDSNIKTLRGLDNEKVINNIHTLYDDRRVIRTNVWFRAKSRREP